LFSPGRKSAKPVRMLILQNFVDVSGIAKKMSSESSKNCMKAYETTNAPQININERYVLYKIVVTGKNIRITKESARKTPIAV